MESGVALENGALPIERQRIAILRDDSIEDDLIGDQRLFDDALGHGSRGYALFFALPAGPLLTLDQQHKILRRFYVELFALLVADHHRIFSADAALGLLRRAGHDLFYACKMRGKTLAAGMFLPVA